MSLVAAVAALLRRLRAERVMALLIFVVVAVTSFAVAAGPRLFNHVADDGLRYAVAHATAIGRNVQFATVDQVPADDVDLFARVVSRGEAIRARLPDSVDGLIDQSRFVVESTRFQLADPPNFTTYVTLRQGDGLGDQLDVVAGRWPARVIPTAPPNEAAPQPPVFEIALSVPAADAIGVAVGDRLPAAVDPGDPLLRNTFPRPVAAVAFEVVGTFSVRDPAARYWFDDRTLADVAIGGTEDNPLAFATAVFAPDAYGDLIRLDLPNRYRWNLFTDVDRLDAGTLDVLVQDLRRLDATFVTTGAVRPGRVLVRSGSSAWSSAISGNGRRPKRRCRSRRAAGRGRWCGRTDRPPRRPSPAPGAGPGAWPRGLQRPIARRATVGGTADHRPGGPDWTGPRRAHRERSPERPVVGRGDPRGARGDRPAGRR